VCVRAVYFLMSVAQTVQRRMIALMNNAMKSIWNEIVVAYFKVLSQNLPGATGENHDTRQSEQPVFGPRYESEVFQIRSRSVIRPRNLVKCLCSYENIFIYFMSYSII
jgi:hypothetical protein